jgi:predicted MFS family arabinose efflux permease
VIRLIMLSIGALYTPQAAGTAARIVAPEKRGSIIAYVFLGWSLAAAVGLPLDRLCREPLRLARGFTVGSARSAA